MIKTILVPATGNQTDDAVFTSALAVARAFNAHLEMVHVRVDAATTVAAMATDGSGAGRHREAGVDRARRPHALASRNDRHRLEASAGSRPGGNRGDALSIKGKAGPDRHRGRGRGPLGRGGSPPDDRSDLAWPQRVD